MRPMGSTRRRLVWCRSTNTSITSTSGANSTTNVDLLTNFKVAGSSVLGATVRRIMVTLYFAGGTAANGDSLVVAIGRIPVTDIGVGLPNASTVGPLAVNYSWSYWDSRYYETTTNMGEHVEGRWPIDVRVGPRLRDQGETLGLGISFTGGARNINMSFSSKVLLALP